MYRLSTFMFSMPSSAQMFLAKNMFRVQFKSVSPDVSHPHPVMTIVRPGPGKQFWSDSFVVFFFFVFYTVHPIHVSMFPAPSTWKHSSCWGLPPSLPLGDDGLHPLPVASVCAILYLGWGGKKRCSLAETCVSCPTSFCATSAVWPRGSPRWSLCCWDWILDDPGMFLLCPSSRL